MDITTFIAGLIAGIFIGRIRGRAQAAREAELPPGPDPDPELLHRRKMEAILRGERTPTPTERREAREWLEAQKSTVGGAAPGADGTHESPVDTPFDARQVPLARHARDPNP
jgi:hypothetical protein